MTSELTRIARERSLLGELLRIAWPLMISMASTQVMHFVNRIFLSWYSVDAITALVPAGILSFNSICFFIGVASYTNVIVAHYHGRGDRHGLARAFWQGVFFSILSAFFVLALVPVGDWLLTLTSHPPAIQELERTYFAIAMPGGALVVMNHALPAFFTGRGLTRVTMTVNVLGNLLNIAASFVFVFGGWGIPELGIRGAAWALVVSNAFMTLCYLVIVFSPGNRRHYDIWGQCRFHRADFLRLIRFGLPNGVSFFLDIGAFVIFIFLAGNLGKSSLAASNIVLSLEGLSFMPVLGIGTAVATLVGQSLGRGQADLVPRIAWRGLLLAASYAAFVGCVFVFLPDLFLKLFALRDQEGFADILSIAYPLMKVLAVFILMDSVNVTFANAIKGAGDTRYQMIMAVLIAWAVFIPGELLLLAYARLPIVWGWVWACVYLGVLAIVFFFRFRSGKWRHIRIIGE